METINVVDLDILKPNKKIIKLNGKEIDVSFVPLAITFEIDALVKNMMELMIGKTEVNVASDISTQKDLFNIALNIVVIFCEHKYPEMDKEWFDNNTTALQIGTFCEAIKGALENAINGSSKKVKN
jgi:hypothetical protein